MSKCIGCGVTLQDKFPLEDGFVSNLEHNLCERCFMIRNYNKNKVINKSNIDYLNIISNIRDNDIVVYVSSLLTLNLDYINKFKKVILVLTKRDVLPKSIKDTKIINYIKKRYNNIEDILVVSAVKKYNLDNLYNLLCKYKNSNIYFVGITNSGKSTLINELIKSYNGIDGNITVSNYPSTTLDVVDIRIGNLLIKDTPGLVINNSIINYLDDLYIKKVNSKKEIKPITIQIKNSGAILIDELLRIEYETNESSMTLYLSNSLNVSNISLNNPRLKNLGYKEFNILGNQDLVIEDIGFIKFTKAVNIKVLCNNDIYMYLRDRLI